jgi:hypothetical protein
MRLELLLGLLGLGGFAFLLQSKPLPTQSDAVKASEKLDKDPDDPAANTVIGTYMAFVLGKFPEAMPYLAKSSDSTLKNLAQQEIGLAYSEEPDKQVKMGNEWVQASKKFTSLVGLFYDRASFWYVKAWPNLKEPDKTKMRIQAQRLATSRRPGPPRKSSSGWFNNPGIAVIKPTELDNTIARTGSYSAKLFPAKENVPNGYSGLYTIPYPVKGANFEVSAFVRSNETDNQEDEMSIKFSDDQGINSWRKVLLPVDLPFWQYVSIKGATPPNARQITILVNQYSKKGNIWVDDASLRFNLIEDMKNGSFEEK